jgi:hypothetical protein
MHGLIAFLAELFVADEALARSALTAATAATSTSSRSAARAHSGANRFRGVLTIETSYPQVKGVAYSPNSVLSGMDKKQV